MACMHAVWFCIGVLLAVVVSYSFWYIGRFDVASIVNIKLELEFAIFLCAELVLIVIFNDPLA
jgi:hypothetical protein